MRRVSVPRSPRPPVSAKFFARRSAVVLSVCALLALPFASVAWAAGSLVEPLSRAVADGLVRLSAPLRVETTAEPEQLDPASDSSELVIPASTKAASPRAPRAARPEPPQALFVPAATVLQLARGAARPRGAFVAKTALHPTGLRLSGVGALGIGVEDGDILIEALGVVPQSPGQIIGAILEARAKQARYLSGTLWRRGQTLRIVVEQPYLEPAVAPGAGRPAPS